MYQNKAPEDLVHSQALALSAEAHGEGDQTVHLAQEFTLLQVITRGGGGHTHFWGAWMQNHNEYYYLLITFHEDISIT